MDNQNNNTNNTPQTSVPQPQATVPTPQVNTSDMQTSVPMPNETNTNVAPSVTPSTNAFGPSPNMVPSPNISAPQVEEKPQVQTNINKRKVQGIFNVDELLKEFIGPNYDKFLMRPFNIAAFFFTFIYYFYRKMTFFGIIIMLIESALGYFLPTMPYVLLIVNVLCGFLTNKIYANFALRKINKQLIKNAGKSTDYVKGVCSVIGGRSLKRIFTTIVWLILGLTPVIAIATLLNLSTEFKNFVDNFDINNLKLPDVKMPEIELNEKFNGSLSVDKDHEVLDMFVVRTPSVFKPTKNHNTYELEYAYKSSNKANSTCTYNFKGIDGYTSSKDLIVEMQDYFKTKHKSITVVHEDIINRIYWNAFSYETEDANVYYYACNRGLNVYLFQFVDEKNSTSSCHNYASSILNEIVMK